MVFDPLTDSAVGVSTRGLSTGPGKWLSAVTLNGKIYAIPDHATSVLVYDPMSGTLAGVDITAIAAGPYKWQSAAVWGNRIFAAPHNAQAMLVFDTNAGDVYGVDTSSVSEAKGQWGTTVVAGAKVCGVPWDARSFLVHAPPPEAKLGATEDLPSDLSSALLEDFIAAWLSEWVYHAESSLPAAVPSLTVAGEDVRFHVHEVYEDPMQGTPLRLAVVTVEVPCQRAPKASYLVFKGTSFATDFVTNASLSPDFSPFHAKYGECTTFIHRGAYAAMTQIRIHHWNILVDHLGAAKGAGSSKLIVAGHSLGGQYATALLLELFLRQVEPPLPMAETVRCVAFGSPMCFGSVLLLAAQAAAVPSVLAVALLMVAAVVAMQVDRQLRSLQEHLVLATVLPRRRAVTRARTLHPT